MPPSPDSNRSKTQLKIKPNLAQASDTSDEQQHGLLAPQKLTLSCKHRRVVFQRAKKQALDHLEVNSTTDVHRTRIPHPNTPETEIVTSVEAYSATSTYRVKPTDTVQNMANKLLSLTVHAILSWTAYSC